MLRIVKQMRQAKGFIVLSDCMFFSSFVHLKPSASSSSSESKSTNGSEDVITRRISHLENVVSFSYPAFCLLRLCSAQYAAYTEEGDHQ
eukprot:4401020-Amphidinium_carterae.1